MQNTMTYIADLARLVRDARRSWEPGDVDYDAPDNLASWITEAESQEEALKRIYSLASGDLYNVDEELSYRIEEEWAVEHGISETEARDQLYDRELRRQGERILFGRSVHPSEPTS